MKRLEFNIRVDLPPLATWDEVGRAFDRMKQILMASQLYDKKSFHVVNARICDPRLPGCDVEPNVYCRRCGKPLHCVGTVANGPGEGTRCEWECKRCKRTAHSPVEFQHVDPEELGAVWI